MDSIVGAHLYDTRHKNIQVIVSFFIYWCEAHLKSTDMFSVILQGIHSSAALLHPTFIFEYPLHPSVPKVSLSLLIFL